MPSFIKNGCGNEHNDKCCEVCKKLRSLKTTTRKRAKKLGLKFNLTTHYLGKLYQKIYECPACGVDFVDLTTVVRRRTIDRINPKLGYVEGNIQLLCDSCNCQKSRNIEAYIDINDFK